MNATRAEQARLSGVGQRRLAAAMCLAEGLRALADLSVLVDPGGERSAWSVASEIEARLVRFERGGAWVRIRRGGRDPSGPLEEALSRVAACACLPRTQRNIHALLD